MFYENCSRVIVGAIVTGVARHFNVSGVFPVTNLRSPYMLMKAPG